MILRKRTLSIALAITYLAGCSSSEQIQDTSVGQIPQWILSPTIENGIAVSDCVLFSGNMSIDRKQAIANARVLMAGEIESKVEGLDETYQDKIQVNGESTSGSSFSSVSKQVTEKTLVGSRTKRTDIVNIAGKDNLCVLMGIEEGETRELFERLVKSSNRNLSPSQEDVLYQQFKAKQARERLKEAVN